MGEEILPQSWPEGRREKRPLLQAVDERLGSRKIGPWDRVNGDPSLNQVELSWYIGLAMVQPMGHRTCTTLYLCLVGWPSSKASNRAWGPVQLAGENVGPLESTR